jgi:hypothetical protein
MISAISRVGTPSSPTAWKTGLTAEIAIAVFRVAFERWVDKDNRRDLADLMHESLGELKAVAAA